MRVRQSLQGHYLYSDQCRIDNRYYQMSPPNNCSAEVLINAKSGQLECEKNWQQCQELQMLITIYYQITVTADMFVLLNFQKCKKSGTTTTICTLISLSVSQVSVQPKRHQLNVAVIISNAQFVQYTEQK